MTDSYHDELDAVLDTFQWAHANAEYNHGEVRLDRATGELVLTVYVEDSYDADADELVSLEGRTQINRALAPEEMIRQTIHAYLCHEADEQMLFNGKRIFDPHA